LSGKASGLRYSVIVPAYQAMSVIGSCVQALNRQTIPREQFEVIVVDDGSTDRTAAVAREAGADHLLLCTHQGPAAARNMGTEAARGEIVLFTDADCEPVPEWLEQMVAPFADPQVMGAKGAYHTRQREFVARLVQLEYDVRYERMAALSRIDFVDTYAAAYRRDLLLRYGGFDRAYPIPSAEDVDLSFRLARDGHEFRFVPAARVWHRHPTSLKYYLIRKGRYGFWRALLYLRYPNKIRGDAHTDPALKIQFALLAATGLLLAGGIVWRPMWGAGAATLLAFFGTTLPFVRWAWSRDRRVALLWPPITLLRIAMQGGGLAVGLIRHSIAARRLPREAPVG
jgi:cellulose synthase/poly-beta-1,6-N-acetylglucosamine synthase-like glycosyltransferase